MKKLVALLMILVFVFLFQNACLATPEEKPLLGRLTMLGVSEDELNDGIMECFFNLTEFSRYQFFDTFNSMLMALDSGSIAGMTMDEYMAGYLESRMGGFAEYQDDDVPPYTLHFSMLLREDNNELCDRISEIIAEMKTDGTLEALKVRYIDDVIAGNEPAAVKPDHFDGVETLRVALTGDRPPMDYFSGTGEPVGFNTALIAEVARRLGKNVEFVSVDTGARAIALSSNICDIVFWMEAGDFGNWEKADIEDQPEGTIVTEPYLTGMMIYLVRENSPLGGQR